MVLKITVDNDGVESRLEYKLDENNLPTGLEYNIQDLVDGATDKTELVAAGNDGQEVRKEKVMEDTVERVGEWEEEEDKEVEDNINQE